MRRVRTSWKLVASVLCVMMLAAVAGCSQQAKYPTKPLNMVVGWAAGGMTDRLMRGISALAEKQLGQSIVVTNMTGASSAIAVQHVYSQPADGYTLLGGSENPALFQVLDLSARSYDDFDPIILLAGSVPVILVHPDAPWKTIKDLVADLKTKGKEIKMGHTGPGAQPFTVATMMKTALGVECTLVPYDGDAPVLTALMGKQVDFTVATGTSCIEYIRAGKVRPLASCAAQRVKGLENVPLMHEEIPEMKKYLPWGAFYGVFVKKGTPKEIEDKLVSVFKQAAESAEWKKTLEDMVAIPLNLTGEDAAKYIKKWQSITAWILHEGGATKKSPAEFNIPKP